MDDPRMDTIARVMTGDRTPENELEAATAILQLLDQIVADIHLIAQSTKRLADKR